VEGEQGTNAGQRGLTVFNLTFRPCPIAAAPWASKKNRVQLPVYCALLNTGTLRILRKENQVSNWRKWPLESISCEDKRKGEWAEGGDVFDLTLFSSLCNLIGCSPPI